MWKTTKNHTPAQNFDPMRVIKEINHDLCRVTFFHWNGKYLLKLELGDLEQTYKVDEFEVLDPTSLENLLTDEFLNNAMQRFKSMHEDLAKALQEI